jgi:hypothetical protein
MLEQNKIDDDYNVTLTSKRNIVVEIKFIMNMSPKNLNQLMLGMGKNR